MAFKKVLAGAHNNYFGLTIDLDDWGIGFNCTVFHKGERDYIETDGTLMTLQILCFQLFLAI